MKCPICNHELSIIDEWYETKSETDHSALMLHMASYCRNCLGNFDWEEVFKFDKTQDMRQVTEEGKILQEF